MRRVIIGDERIGRRHAAGFADAHASSAAVATLAASGALELDGAALGVLVVVTTNTVTKAVLAFSSGPRAYARHITIGLVLVLAAAWTVAFLGR